MKYNKAGVKALDKIKAVIESFGLPLMFARKFNGIMNAIEMQIEDYRYTIDIIKALDKALLLLAEGYAPKAGYAELEDAIVQFEKKLTLKQKVTNTDSFNTPLRN